MASVPPHLKTTTTGLSDSVTTIRLFQIMSAEQTIIARLSTWCASCVQQATADECEWRSTNVSGHARARARAHLPLTHIFERVVHVDGGVHGCGGVVSGCRLAAQCA